MDELAKQLTELGFEIDMGFAQHHVVVINRYTVRIGPFSGEQIRVGIPAKDFPFTAPAGVHIAPPLVPTGRNNVNCSPLGTDWQYWSRRLDDWKGSDRTARHIISYINKVLLHAA